MDEILRALPESARVLDLGSQYGSFPLSATRAFVARLDRDSPPGGVRADAAALPFGDGAFDAVIANHSLEHFDRLDDALREMGRVVRRDGAIYVAVPDASTFTDRVYRWIGRGGGHVNPFTSREALSARIERATGLPFRGARTLHSSLAFLNRRGSPVPRPKRLILLGGGYEWTLRVYTFVSRRLDR